MKLVVGLGNPGRKFQKTRHNIGFRAVDEIAANFQFPIFNFQSIFNAKISKGTFKSQKIILAKPQTFMNNSGVAVKKLIRDWELEIRNLVVVHDDIDLPLGKIRISIGRGAAGHKGVESIIKELKTKNFTRFRIGIHPIGTNCAMAQKLPKKKIKNVEHFVLQKFNKDEEKIVKKVIKKTVRAVEIALKEGVEKTMNKLNR